jgi:hypothetical protein
VSSIWTWGRHFNVTEGNFEAFRGIDESDEMMDGVNIGEEEWE